jgi:hypothetical protein
MTSSGVNIPCRLVTLYKHQTSPVDWSLSKNTRPEVAPGGVNIPCRLVTFYKYRTVLAKSSARPGLLKGIDSLWLQTGLPGQTLIQTSTPALYCFVRLLRRLFT